MIPVSLKLANFTSYGSEPQELDFRKFHLAAISGPNGAGKSSLLDAITWAIWGQSRAGESSDELVRLGAKNMEVDFSFELDNHIYTVKRKRIRISGGTSSLELWSGSMGSIQAYNLTEGTIKATQQKIIDLLHLSFETFTNSSFLRQGHADEFTTKGPSDRKRVLSNILGLDHFDKLEEKAKEKIKVYQTKLTLLEYQLLEVEAEVSLKEDREKSLSLAQLEAKQAEDKLKELEKLITQVQEKAKYLEGLVKSLEDKKNQIDSIQKETLDLKLQIDLKEKTKQEFSKILAQRKEIEKNYQFLQNLQEQKEDLEKKRSILIKLKDELVVIRKRQVDRENKRTQAIMQLEIQVKEKQTLNSQLETQNFHLRQHKDTCPTCGQGIDEKKNKQIMEDNLQKIKKNNLDILQLQEKISKYKKITLPEEIEARGKEIQVKKSEEDTKNYSQVLKQVLDQEKYLDLYSKLQQASVAIRGQEESLLDLKKIITSRENQIKILEKELENYQELEKNLNQARLEIKAQEKIKEELSQKTLLLRGDVGEKKQLVDRVTQLEELFLKRKSEKNNLLKEKEIFEQLSLAFGKKGIQAMIIESSIPEIEEETNKLLDSLTEGRMKVRFETQRETKTKVLTLNGKKDFGLVETLDIIISDEMGERPYENYSGGEQFRVNFAIRIAVSRLLAHRAGAKLQFLVIDEGFGTQDAQGISKIVEAINIIKDDFAKILIITHLDELKEEFPVRIEVSKGATGSVFEVVGG